MAISISVANPKPLADPIWRHDMHAKNHKNKVNNPLSIAITSVFVEITIDCQVFVEKNREIPDPLLRNPPIFVPKFR